MNKDERKSKENLSSKKTKRKIMKIVSEILKPAAKTGYDSLPIPKRKKKYRKSIAKRKRELKQRKFKRLERLREKEVASKKEETAPRKHKWENMKAPGGSRVSRKICAKCGEATFWGESNGGYSLFNAVGGKRHRCKKPKAKKLTKESNPEVFRDIKERYGLD